MNKFFAFTTGIFVVTLLWLDIGQAQFRNNQDREIVKDVLKTFGKECTLRSAYDGDILKRLELEASNGRRSKIQDIQFCFENHFSQITGVYFLYLKICGEVSGNSAKTTDSILAKQILEVSKYQSGIRPFHSILNDCLINIPERKGRSFTVPLAGNDLDVHLLQKQIEEIQVGSPFPSTSEPFR